MGRIKTKLMRRLTFETLGIAREKLSKDFNQNKLVVNEALPGASKKIRNTVAGYATRLMKMQENY